MPASHYCTLTYEETASGRVTQINTYTYGSFGQNAGKIKSLPNTADSKKILDDARTKNALSCSLSSNLPSAQHVLSKCHSRLRGCGHKPNVQGLCHLRGYFPVDETENEQISK